MTLTVDDLRGHVTTELADGALGLLLDAAYEAIDAHAGAEGNVTELLTPGPGPRLMLSRPASAITSVTEGTTTLATTDYSLVVGQMLRRLDTGDNPATRWLDEVTVTYTPSSDSNERDRVAIALVKLELNREPGTSSERLGDWAVSQDTGKTYAEQREEILASLHQVGVFIR